MQKATPLAPYFSKYKIESLVFTLLLFFVGKKERKKL